MATKSHLSILKHHKEIKLYPTLRLPMSPNKIMEITVAGVITTGALLLLQETLAPIQRLYKYM